MCHLTSRKIWAISFLFYTCLSVTWSNVLFAQTNGNITLKTSITQGIQEILWKFQGNKVADWDELSGVTDYLQFKRRTYLVRETGDLTIFSLKSEDSGSYEGELIINGNIHTVKHDLSIIDPGSKSNIICKIIDDDNAILLCQAEGPHLSYSWSGPGLNTGFNGQIGPNVSRVENANSDYSCVVKNPVSEMTVHFKAADCFTRKTLVILLPILALIVLGLGLAIAVFIYMKKRSSKGNEHFAHMQGKDDREENEQRETDNSTPPHKSPLFLPLKLVVDEEAKTESNITSTPPQINPHCLPVPPKPLVPPLPRQNNAAHSEESCNDMAGGIDGGETTVQTDTETDTETTQLLKIPPSVPPKPVSAGTPLNNAAISEQNGEEGGTEAKMETSFASPPPQVNPSHCPTVAPKPRVPPLPKQNNAGRSEESCTDMAGGVDGGETTVQTDTETTQLLKIPPSVPPKPVSAGTPLNNAAISEQNGEEGGTEAKMETNFASPPPQVNPSHGPTVDPMPFSSSSSPNEEEGIQVEKTHMTTHEKTPPVPPPKPSRLDSSQNADNNPAEDTDET
ncbi:uncharacterized protein LOC134087807 isoform X2 [Sardina pilchardus]|uniref:uncharacterized protein LOC134087807 isoform X2 n=1 Tax=Sardina pilchardus TaxID=27697 RepID=UPI002E151681